MSAISTVIEVLTFAELLTRWNKSENDIRRKIIGGELVPSFWIGIAVKFEEAVPDEGCKFSRLVEVNIGLKKVGLYYLPSPKQTGPLDGVHPIISRCRRLDWQGGKFLLPKGAFVLIQPLSLGEVIATGCVTLEEVERCERLEVKKANTQDAPVIESALKAIETTDQRCTRLLLWLQEEKGKGSRGALARVVKRDGRARQTVAADIKRAEEQKKEVSNPMARMARIISR